MYLSKLAVCGGPARGCLETIVSLLALMVPPLFLSVFAAVVVILSVLGGDLFIAFRLFGGSP